MFNTIWVITAPQLIFRIKNKSIWIVSDISSKSVRQHTSFPQKDQEDLSVITERLAAFFDLPRLPLIVL